MLHSRRRPALQAAVAAMVLVAAMSGPALEARPLFRPRPGPTDHPLAIGAADFDRDGHDDLVVAEYQAAVLELLVGRGDGTFAPIPSGPIGVGTATLSTPTTGPFALIVTDLNPNDADSDTIPNASDNCPNFPNGPELGTDSQLDTNNYGVGDACRKLKDTDADGVGDAPIDTDGDGIPDYDPTTHRLDNCPRLPNPLQEDTETAKGSDGLCGTKDDNPLLYGVDGLCGTGDDKVGDGVGDACAVSPDILILTTSVGSGSPLGAVRVRMNDGSGGMVNRSSYVTGLAPSDFHLADVGGDGIPDLLIANASIDLVQLFFGSGDGQFTSGLILTTGKGPQALLAADIDNDGDLDPIVANGTEGSLSLYRNATGAIPTAPTETFPTAPHPSVLLTGRVNADVYPDVVVLSQGNLLCTLGPRAGLPCSADSECADLVEPAQSGTCTGGDGAVQVFAGGPAGPPPGLVAGPTISLGPGHRPRAGALRDLDGDGDLDLAIADFTGGAVLILAGNGDGTFAPPATIAVGGGPADLAFLTLDAPTLSDLAVIDATNDRIDLLEQGSGTGYSLAPTSPASPWNDTASMALIGADSVVGFDAVLLQRQGARVDVLSGIGDGSFRATPVVAPTGTTSATAFVSADLRQDGRPDLAILNGAAGTVTVLTGEVSGQFQERATLTATPGADRVAATALSESIADYDRDGVPNVVDDCPTVYNPPMCKVTDPACPATIACTNTTLTPTACDFASDPTVLDPATGQCDTDRNGIGDHCQILGSTTATPDVCFALDSDFDLKADYDQNALKKTTAGELDFDGDGIANALDNCPTVSNATQTDTDANGVGDACQTVGALGQSIDSDDDTIPDYDVLTQKVDNCPLIPNLGQEDNDGDKVGNACIVAAALDNCVSTLNPGQEDRDGDGVGNACSAPAQDLFLIDSAPSGRIDVLEGDNSGGFRPSPVSPLTGLSGPTAVTSGHYTLSCPVLAGLCNQGTVFDLAVTEAGTLGASGDDFVALLAGDPAGGAFTSLPPFPLGADPTRLLRAPDQPVCPVAGSVTTPSLRFDIDTKSDYLVVLTPGDSGLNVLVPSNQHVLDASLSPLVRPVALNAPIVLASGPVDLLLTDVNQDLKQDLVVLSSSGGSTTITPYLGLGNGLFFTDPGLVTTGLPFTSTHVASANIDLKTDSVYPDVLLFETRDEAPFSLLNVLPERADIDGSGRVDGYDLALLARAFGASRGEDFTLLPDATFARTGNGPGDVILHTGAAVPGQDLPDSDGLCNNTFNPGTALYGIPVDINLDGIVDGVDLAFLASRFGSSLP